MATLTFAYADATVVLGPMSAHAEPGSYDLCAEHTHKFSPPRGWEVIRLPGDISTPQPSGDDLMLLADAVRKAGLGVAEPAVEPQVASAQRAPVGDRRS